MSKPVTANEAFSIMIIGFKLAKVISWSWWLVAFVSIAPAVIIAMMAFIYFMVKGE